MHCFVYGEVGSDNTPPETASEHWDTWTPTEFTNASWWSEQYAPQASVGPSATAQDFAWAQHAGVDALGVLFSDGAPWWSHYSAALNAVAGAASNSPVKIMPDLWPSHTLSATEATAYGQAVKAWMDAYPNGFAKVNGKPVISLGASAIVNDPAAAARFQHFFDAWPAGRAGFYLIADIDHTAASAADWSFVDAFSTWPTFNGWSEGIPNTWLEPLMSSHGVAWPVVPSFFQSRYVVPRMMSESLGVSHYIDSWEQAFAAGSPMVQIETFNDFGEDSSITDSNVRGSSLLDLTAYFTQWAHTGQQPAVTQDRVFLFHHRQLTGTKLTSATLIATVQAWTSKTPPTDYIDIVTMLTAPGTVTIAAGSGQWSKNVPAGLHQWLLYVPPTVTTCLGGNNPSCVQAGSYPVTTAERDVTVIPALAPSTPTIELTRNGKVVLAGSSRTGWPASAKWQDMSMIGDEFTVTP